MVILFVALFILAPVFALVMGFVGLVVDPPK